jgi:dynein intermediate chain 2, axonemal
MYSLTFGLVVGKIFQVNTERTIHRHVGVRHVEGGWPENVDSTEIDQVDRFLKKALKVFG